MRLDESEYLCGRNIFGFCITKLLMLRIHVEIVVLGQMLAGIRVLFLPAKFMYFHFRLDFVFMNQRERNDEKKIGYESSCKSFKRINDSLTIFHAKMKLVTPLSID